MLLAAAWLPAGCHRQPAVQQPVEKLRVALSATPHATLLHLAVIKGFFAAEGLDVAVTPASHGKAAMDLLSQDRVDLASAAEVPFVISVMNGEPLTAIASVVSVSSEMAVVGRRDRGIAAPRDLAGKRVAVTAGTSGEYFLWAFLIRHNLAPDAVTLVDLPPGRITEELARGNVDAVATWQPVVASAEGALGANAASLIEPHAYTVTHLVVGRSEFVRSHPEAMRRMVRAMLRSEDYARNHPDDALALAATHLMVEPATLRRTWSDLKFHVDLRQSQLVTLEDEARWAMARGYARQGPVPNFLPNLHPEPLLDVRPERVSLVR